MQKVYIYLLFIYLLIFSCDNGARADIAHTNAHHPSPKNIFFFFFFNNTCAAAGNKTFYAERTFDCIGIELLWAIREREREEKRYCIHLRASGNKKASFFTLSFSFIYFFFYVFDVCVKNFENFFFWFITADIV